MGQSTVFWTMKRHPRGKASDTFGKDSTRVYNIFHNISAKLKTPGENSFAQQSESVCSKQITYMRNFAKMLFLSGFLMKKPEST